MKRIGFTNSSKDNEKVLRNRLVIAIIVACAVFNMFWILVNWQEGKVYGYNLDNDCVDDTIRSNIDSIKTESKYIIITGWAFCPKKQYREIEEHIVLINRETGDAFSIPTELSDRPDVQDAYGDENYDYTLSGFNARVSMKKIEEEINSYDIYVCIILDNETHIRKIGEGITEE